MDTALNVVNVLLLHLRLQNQKHSINLVIRYVLTVGLLMSTCINSHAQDIAAGANAAADEDWLYSFRPGDTLWAVCKRYTGKSDCWLTIGDYNQVNYPRKIPPGTVIRFPVSWLKHPPVPATLSYVSGEVTLRLRGETQYRAAQEGDLLQLGTRIRTSDKSHATIRFADGSLLILEPQSDLQLDRLTNNGESGMVDTRVRLFSGGATSKVPKRQPPVKFNVETPAAIAAVRGTEFRVSVDPALPSEMRSEVLEGLVGVSNEQSTEDVPKGFGLLAKKDEALSPPVELLAAPQLLPVLSPQSGGISLRWQPNENVGAYKVVISQAENPESVVFTGEVAVPEIVTPALAEGCYIVAVFAISEVQLLGLPAKDTACVTSTLAAPSPSTLKISHNDSELTWPAIEGAAMYRIELSEVETFDSPETELLSETAWQLRPESLKTYRYLRIVAVGQHGIESPPSDVVVLTQTQWEKWMAIGISVIVIVVGIL
ncbi:FecR family protein [Aurantivibrio plasticivorans]